MTTIPHYCGPLYLDGRPQCTRARALYELQRMREDYRVTVESLEIVCDPINARNLRSWLVAAREQYAKTAMVFVTHPPACTHADSDKRAITSVRDLWVR